MPVWRLSRTQLGSNSSGFEHQATLWVHDTLNIYPPCGIFHFPWHRHQIEGRSIYREVNETASVLKRQQMELNHWPFNQQSDDHHTTITPKGGAVVAW